MFNPPVFFTDFDAIYRPLFQRWRKREEFAPLWNVGVLYVLHDLTMDLPENYSIYP